VFAGIWTTWQGASGTKANPVASEHQLFGSLTTEANDVVGDIHPKAMPVILMTEGITVRRKSRARFFSGIGPKQTCADALHLSALRHKGDIAVKGHSRRLVGREVSVVEVVGENHSRKSYTDK
jgi:hypothetical protein